MKTEHTNGEWEYINLNRDGQFAIRSKVFRNSDANTPSRGVATLANYGDMSYDEKLANAKLIAASPELLKELESKVVLLSKMVKHFENKATTIDDLSRWVATIKKTLASSKRVMEKAT